MNQILFKLKEYIYKNVMDKEEYDTELDYILQMVMFDIKRNTTPNINELTEYIYKNVMDKEDYDTELDYMLEIIKFEYMHTKS